jgi:RNA polymerase sigma-70 factor (ECF subfamily)
MSTTTSELLRRIALGDHEALAELFDLQSRLVSAVALRVVRDRAEAEDVVQETFLQVWRQAGRFDPSRGRPEAWLCTIARTRALDRLRRRAARREEQAEPPPSSAALPACPAEAHLVRKALAGLSEDQRRALELAYYEGLTQSEIATRLGEPLGTIKTRIRTALIRLRETLS